MTDETREDLALKVLQAFADIEDTTSLESKAHLERIQGYTKDERNAMVSELIKLSYIVDEAFNHGILEHGIICLERGYVFTDSVLIMKKAQAKEESRHNELVDLQKAANGLTKQANDSAERSAKAAEDSARHARTANIISVLSFLIAFASVVFTLVDKHFNKYNDTTDSSNRYQCENDIRDNQIVGVDSLNVHTITICEQDTH